MTGPQRFGESERAATVAEYRAAVEKLDVVTAALDERENAADAELKALYWSLQTAVAHLSDGYRNGLPRPLLSRCPFTGADVRHSIDPYGLDGPWWNYSSPIRPREELPVTFFAVHGAVRLGGEVERTPFLCIPGPEVPYVLPQLLEREDIRAVVSSLGVGRHQAYAVFYFAQPVPAIPRVNDWGTDRYTVVGARGLVWQHEREPGPHELDFDLERWIRAGKLHWIAPNDERAILRSDVSGCPFIGLAGRRSLLRIEGEKVWTDADVLRRAKTGATGVQ
jgi:hypothetical protein